MCCLFRAALPPNQMVAPSPRLAARRAGSPEEESGRVPRNDGSPLQQTILFHLYLAGVSFGASDSPKLTNTCIYIHYLPSYIIALNTDFVKRVIQ